jgi:hypothetical protein
MLLKSDELVPAHRERKPEMFDDSAEMKTHRLAALVFALLSSGSAISMGILPIFLHA